MVKLTMAFAFTSTFACFSFNLVRALFLPPSSLRILVNLVGERGFLPIDRLHPQPTVVLSDTRVRIDERHPHLPFHDYSGVETGSLFDYILVK